MRNQKRKSQLDDQSNQIQNLIDTQSKKIKTDDWDEFWDLYNEYQDRFQTERIQDKEYIFDLYHKVKNNKGYFDVCNEDKWNLIGEESQQVYEKYLYHFEIFDRYFHKQLFIDVNILKNMHQIDFSFYQKVKIFELDDYLNQDQMIDEAFTHNCSIIRGLSHLIDNSIFTINQIRDYKPNQKVDLRHQNPNTYSFNPNHKMCKQTTSQKTISEYVQYQLKMDQYSDREIIKLNTVQYGVNIDIENWPKYLAQLQKFPKQLLYLLDYDADRYLRSHILGITQPQLYLKVKGAWTGGHQENANLRAINYNHGPSDSLWITIDVQYVEAFRQIVLDKFKVDISKEEGLWFSDWEFVNLSKIPVKVFKQKPGDFVLLGPGCLHWVRSEGMAVNSAWNFCDQNLFQFEYTYARFQLNKIIDFTTIVPVKTLFLDYLNHEIAAMPQDLKQFLIIKIKEFHNLEEQQFKQLNFKITNFQYEPPSNIFQCHDCRAETFNYWIFCKACKKEYQFFCLQCGKDHQQKCKKPSNIKYYFKYKRQDIVKLYTQANEKNSQCLVEDLCRPGLYIGNIQTKCMIQQQEIEENEDENEEDIQEEIQENEDEIEEEEIINEIKTKKINQNKQDVLQDQDNSKNQIIDSNKQIEEEIHSLELIEKNQSNEKDQIILKNTSEEQKQSEYGTQDNSDQQEKQIKKLRKKPNNFFSKKNIDNQLLQENDRQKRKIQYEQQILNQDLKFNETQVKKNKNAEIFKSWDDLLKTENDDKVKYLKNDQIQKLIAFKIFKFLDVAKDERNKHKNFDQLSKEYIKKRFCDNSNSFLVKQFFDDISI